MQISHIEIYAKKLRVGYRTNFPVNKLHVFMCPRAFTTELSYLVYAQQGCGQVRTRITLIQNI